MNPAFGHVALLNALNRTVHFHGSVPILNQCIGLPPVIAFHLAVPQWDRLMK